MGEVLWRIDALVAASAGRADGDAASLDGILGVSIDTRTLSPGDLFVALKDQRDGHEFVPAAFAKGAAAALVADNYQRQPGDGLLIRVDDVMKALERIGIAARARLSREAYVIAVTGSAGKTTAKDMLRLCLAQFGACHASDKSFNNHWGVPLTLARMPAGSRFGIFEIGMNHAGEITPLTRMVRPDIAIVTTVEAAHLAAFASVEDIARAKAEIMAGLEPGGVAVLNRDNPHYAILRAAALERPGVNVVSFGAAPMPAGDGGGSLTLLSETPGERGTRVKAHFGGKDAKADGVFEFDMAASGHHMVMNALAVLAAANAARIDVVAAAAQLQSFGPPAGRGSRQHVAVEGGTILLIDESYNANPASMRAALMAMSSLPRAACPRRIAVLGDMLELGDQAEALHAQLADAIAAAEIDLVYAAGPCMKHLYARLPATRQALWAPQSQGLEAALVASVRAGDAVMVKGSNGSRMGPLVERIRRLGVKAA